MRRANSAERSAPAFGAVVLLLAVTVGGCSSSSTIGSGSVSDWFPSIPGFSKPETKSVDATAMAAAAATTTTPTTEWKPSVDNDCPTVDIRQGASTLAIAAKPQDPTANDVRYQLSFTQLARQCALDGSMMRMRVGVQGRVIVGPAGAPNQVNVPVRYAVVQEGVEPKTIITKLRRFPVTMPPGVLNVAFTDIEEDLTFPVPSSQGALDAYVVYVGFDNAAERDDRRPAKKAAPKAKQQR